MFELAHRFRLPLVLFGEGGGGRPGEDDIGPRVAIDTKTFTTFSQLLGPGADDRGRERPHASPATRRWSPARDVIIATEGSTLGMGGPAMIEGGGLGIYTPEEVGPMSFQVPNGVVDILVKDEDEAVDTVKKYLSYFQGAMSDLGGARPAAHCGTPSRRTGCGSTTCARSSTPSRRQGLGAGAAREVRHRHHHRLHPGRGPADGRDRQQSRITWPARSTRTAPTRARASCSCATPSTSRC